MMIDEGEGNGDEWGECEDWENEKEGELIGG